MSESTTVATQFNVDDLRNIKSFDEAKAFITQHQGGIVNASDHIGDGFELLKNKRKLIDVGFLIIDFAVRKSDKYDDTYYVSFRCITVHGEKYVVNDGSTGLAKQLMGLEERGILTGIGVKNGLRVSEYDYTDNEGKISKAETFYLAV